MANKQVLDYTKKSLEKGYTVEQISTALLDQGWSPTEINEALLKAQETIQQKLAKSIAPPAPPKKSEWSIDLKSLSASQILLYLGGLIIVLAGAIYIGINWSQWGLVARIFAIFLPMLICYIVGVPMFFNDGYKKQSVVFLAVGSLLFPFFLTILFKELKIFAQPFYNDFCIAVSFLYFVFYLVSSFIFRFPIWAFLYQGAGLSVFYFLIVFVGAGNIFGRTTMSWLFLVLGTAYLFFSLLYDKSGQKDEGRYSYRFGTLVVAWSFIVLLNETFSNQGYLAYLLFILGVAYFFFGVFCEKNNFRKYCQAPYFIGAGVIFFSLSRLASGGTLLKNLTGSAAHYSWDIFNWSSLIIGIVYMFIGWVWKIKILTTRRAPKFKILFDVIGPLFVLGSILNFGSGGNKPIYETLLLLSSLGFILGVF